MEHIVKASLSVKFLTGYLAVGLLAFLFVTFLSPWISQRYLLQREKKRLLEGAEQVADLYYEDTHLDPDTVLLMIRSFSHGLEASVWITNENGTIQLNSDWNSPQEPVLTDFDPLDFGKSNYIVGDFYGMFREQTISVYLPLSSQFRTQGYVLIHEPLSALSYQQNILINMNFTTAAVTFLLSGILLILFRFLVSRPIRKISSAVGKYARGDLTHHVELHRRDELGYLANALNDMSNRLNQIEEDQKKFLANVSHDFRSPLTSIKGYAEAIQDGTIPPELQPKYLQIIVDEIGRLTKLTQNMLELNTFSSRGAYLDYSDFDINHEIRKVIASMEGNCRERRITFDMIQSDRVLMVTADLGRIQQVLYNLIDNAIKFSHTNGVITIETSRRHGQAFISIKDTGVGISKENIQKIWTRFYKTDSSRGKDKKSTGLGLSIVKEIIEAHGTTIDVISTEGVGSEFIFRLKLAEDME